MKRSCFKSKLPPQRPAKQIEGYTPRPRAVAVAAAGPAQAVVSVPKQEPIQHAGYMAVVRQMACARCGISGYTQFCHSDSGGKGMGIKTDCRLGWPGCGPHGSLPGCHWIVGTSGQLKQTARRAFERSAGDETRRIVRSMGLWPKTLPAWHEDEVTP